MIPKQGSAIIRLNIKMMSTTYKEKVMGRPLRPMSNNTKLFYYLHTHIKPDALEEPNPTLYIGKLKK